MNRNKNGLILKIGIMLVFSLAIILLILLVLFFFTPPKDITNWEPDIPESSSNNNQPATTEPSESTDITENIDTVPVFKSDLSLYEQYMTINDSQYLVLVNASNPLSSTYEPSDLVEITNVRNDGRVEYMRKDAEMALQALFIEAEAEGMTYKNQSSGQVLSVMSGYRSYSKQDYLFNYYTENEMRAHPEWTLEEAEKYVSTYSNRPGTSEHQTGLCVDMHNLSSADTSFKTEAASDWLKENCYKFGFILRYPENKENITNISYEPWHFRFVGRYHATRMHELDMCLEEYVAFLNKNQS